MKKIIFTLLFCTLLIPSLVNAAWWNPFSWNWKALFTTPTEQVEVSIEAPTIDVKIENEPAILPPEPQEVQKPFQKESVVSPTYIIIPPQQPVQPIATPVIEDIQLSVPTIPQVLNIQNVKNDVSKKSATITWTTSVAARSQLLLDNGNGKGFESLNGISTNHEVEVGDLIPSTEYTYKIVARTQDGKLIDDYYGSFTAIREFTISPGIEDNCRFLLVKDSVGKPMVDMKLIISGTYTVLGSNAFIGIPQTEIKTDVNGKAKLPEVYCSKNNLNIWITGENFEAGLKF